MGYVMDAEGVTAIEKMLHLPHYTVESLSVPFTTTEEFVRSVLPPGLEVTDNPSGVASVARWQSRKLGEFTSSAVSINARFQDIEGAYDLTLIMDGDMPVSIGREYWGEVKKHGHLNLFHDDQFAYGFAERNGTRLIQIDCAFESELTPGSSNSTSLQLKAFPSGTGIGLEHDPVLLVLDARTNSTIVREGSAELTLTGTPWDPVDTIPVTGVGRARYEVGSMTITCREPETMPGAREDYIPYVYGRHYDDLRLFHVTRRFIDDSGW